MLAGVAGGLVGGWVMSQFTRVWDKTLPLSRTNRVTRSSLYSPQEWDSISRSAEWIAAPFVHRRLSPREKQMGGAMVHYAVSGAAGALYGTTAHYGPGITKFRGLPFGTAIWLLGNEIIMPAFGLTKKLSKYSLLMQANALGEHLVYGFTTNLVYRGLTSR